ncbi:MAG: nuclear transport factor 2 family protein [Balneola sp.]
MKRLLISGLLLLSTGYISAQNMDHANHKNMSASEEVEAVKKVLKAYKDALEALDVSGTQKLFTEDADVFENGKYEGSYQDYLDHHIGPELGHFKEFSFIDYKVDVQIEGKIAVAFETYNYKIVIDGEEERIVERQAVATSVLKKTESGWKIMQNHGSSRAVRN